MTTPAGTPREASARWSNRILFLSLLGIAYLTLFPFRFDFSPTLVFHKSPLLLVSSVKRSGYYDFFLNVLLFVPFGFGIAAHARKRGLAAGTAFLLALAAGACGSYLVEVLQFYIPARDSGWEDVFSNTSGSVVGCFFFQLCGRPLLHLASSWEDTLQGWLSTRRAALLLIAYFALWFGVSARLQRQTRLSNWDPQAILSVGNDASGQNPWRGQVFRLQIWNRALSEQEIRAIAGQSSANLDSPGLLASYDFTGTPPHPDERNFLPPLDWTLENSAPQNADPPHESAKPWLSTKVPAESLMRGIMNTGRFTVHLVCVPAPEHDVNGRILAFSKSAGDVNFLLREEGDALVFRLRNPLSTRRALLGLAWYVRGVFAPGEKRDLIALYDGSDEFVYLDGERVREEYRLSPAAGLMHRVRYIEPEALEGYITVYETLIFLPAGLLIGLAARRWSRLNFYARLTLVLGWVLPPLLLEILLVAESGRRMWVGNVALSLVFGLMGVLLVNADRGFKNPADAA